MLFIPEPEKSLRQRVQVFCDLLIQYRRAEEGLCRLDLSRPLESARKVHAAMDEARELLRAEVLSWEPEPRPGGLIVQNGALKILLEDQERENAELKARVKGLERKLVAERARSTARPARGVASVFAGAKN